MKKAILQTIAKRWPLTILMCCLLFGVNTFVNAKNLGVQGAVFPIEETSLLDVIQQRLLDWQNRGELQQKVNALKKQIEHNLRHLPNLSYVTPATENRVRFFNPSVVVTRLITDDAGQILALPGQVINPLERMSLGTSLIFTNLSRKEEREWLESPQRRLKDTAIIILTGGDIMNAMERLGRRVYYDNHGVLMKRLSLQHTPTIVTEVNQELRLEEIKL